MKNAAQPYLHFTDNCKEAMSFYQGIFGGELEMTVVGDSPAKEHFPKEIHHQILHSSLKNGDFFVMASDMCGMGDAERGNALQMNLNCDSKEEIDTLYKSLTEGGKIIEALNEPFWGGLFAMVQDRFGVRWMLSFDH
jgi:PhnB protein